MHQFNPSVGLSKGDDSIDSLQFGVIDHGEEGGDEAIEQVRIGFDLLGVANIAHILDFHHQNIIKSHLTAF